MLTLSLLMILSLHSWKRIRNNILPSTTSAIILVMLLLWFVVNGTVSSTSCLSIGCSCICLTRNVLLWLASWTVGCVLELVCSLVSRATFPCLGGFKAFVQPIALQKSTKLSFAAMGSSCCHLATSKSISGRTKTQINVGGCGENRTNQSQRLFRWHPLLLFLLLLVLHLRSISSSKSACPFVLFPSPTSVSGKRKGKGKGFRTNKRSYSNLKQLRQFQSVNAATQICLNPSFCFSF